MSTPKLTAGELTFGVAIVLGVLWLASLGCKDSSGVAPYIPPGDQSFVVSNGMMDYVVDPLNEICLVYYGRITGLALLPYDDCLRIIRRYTMPLSKLKPEVEEMEDGG